MRLDSIISLEKLTIGSFSKAVKNNGLDLPLYGGDYLDMKKIRNISYSNRHFMAGVLVFFLILALYLLITSRASGFKDLNLYHSPFLNSFFYYYTNLGDGLFSIFLVLIFLLLRRFDLAIQILLAFLISGLFSQILKAIVISPRPRDFFPVNDQIYIVDGLTLGGNASFPSGHTASAFALATSLALYAKEKIFGILYLILAILVGYSRIYLSQHFPADVFGGAVIGVLVAFWIFIVMENYNPAIMKRSRKNRDVSGI
jgi:membrane-associated phospholipid phosphatase